MSASIVAVAGAHEVGSRMKPAFRVRSSEVSGSPPVSSWAIVESSPPSGRSVTAASFLSSPRMAMPSRAGSPGSGATL